MPHTVVLCNRVFSVISASTAILWRKLYVIRYANQKLSVGSKNSLKNTSESVYPNQKSQVLSSKSVTISLIEIVYLLETS